jgi:serine/threonine-protein kinase
MQTVLAQKEQTFQQTEYLIGPYRLVKHLRQGGMSSVYLAYHRHTGAYVALKVVDTRVADLQLLYREKEIMQALDHEHIVPCLDAGQDANYYYMAMPYLRGGTLEDMIEERPLTPEEACLVLEQLTAALAYIHKLGILHRDIKPGNVLFDLDYHVYLTDFGIASWLGEKPQHRGRVMGTPHYTAPELFDGYVDERSEVYSVGILLYQALTGTLPFDDPSDVRICIHHRETPPLAPSLINPSIPRAVERVILCALEKDPRQRYQSVEELFRAFQHALEAPNFFGYLSTQWHTTCQKLRSRLAPETPPYEPIVELAALEMREQMG